MELPVLATEEQVVAPVPVVPGERHVLYTSGDKVVYPVSLDVAEGAYVEAPGGHAPGLSNEVVEGDPPVLEGDHAPVGCLGGDNVGVFHVGA